MTYITVIIYDDPFIASTKYYSVDLQSIQQQLQYCRMRPAKEIVFHLFANLGRTQMHLA